jgi:hypothetical protein
MSNITPSPKPSDSTASEQESSNHIHSGSELLQGRQSPSGDVTHLLQRLNTGSSNDDSDQQQHNDASSIHNAVARAISQLRYSSPTSSHFLEGATPLLSTTHFQELLQCVKTALQPSIPSTTQKDDHLLQVVRSEHYISQGLVSKFDGKHETLAPWIKKFRTLRSNALWKEATYIKVGDKRYDILSDFTKIKEDTIKLQATSRWTPEEQLKSLHPEHSDLFYARILGKVVISSITDEFYTTLQNYAGDELASDGPLLLWLILTHFHTSTVTYHDSLKQQIRTRDLASDHQHDIESYLIWLRHQIDVLRSTSVSPHDTHADLLDPIFQQLLATKSSRFKRIVEDWHLEYHTEERNFTPTTLVDLADKKCKALRHSTQLYSPQDTELLALATTPAPTSGTTHPTKSSKATHRLPRPAWYTTPPTNPLQTHQFDNRTWHLWLKCGNGGKWVCTHSAAQHSDTYVKKRRGEGQPQQPEKRPSPSPPPQANVATAINAENLAKLVAEQVTHQLNTRHHGIPPSPTPFYQPVPPAPTAPAALLAQPTPPPPALAQMVADQVHHQLHTHYASTQNGPPPPPPYTAPTQPYRPNPDILDW